MLVPKAAVVALATMITLTLGTPAFKLPSLSHSTSHSTPEVPSLSHSTHSTPKIAPPKTPSGSHSSTPHPEGSSSKSSSSKSAPASSHDICKRGVINKRCPGGPGSPSASTASRPSSPIRSNTKPFQNQVDDAKKNYHNVPDAATASSKKEANKLNRQKTSKESTYNDKVSAEKQTHGILRQGAQKLGIDTTHNVGAREHPHEHPAGDNHATANVQSPTHPDQTYAMHAAAEPVRSPGGTHQMIPGTNTPAFKFDPTDTFGKTQLFPGNRMNNEGKYAAGDPTTRRYGEPPSPLRRRALELDWNLDRVLYARGLDGIEELLFPRHVESLSHYGDFDNVFARSVGGYPIEAY